MWFKLDVLVGIFTLISLMPISSTFEAEDAHQFIAFGEILVGYSKDLTEVPTGIPETIIDIRLSNNRIRKLRTHAFYQLPNVKIINLSANEISEIHPNAFVGLPIIKVLLLQENKLPKLEYEMLKGLDNLWKLSIQHNKIQTIGDNTFKDMEHLEILNLTDNHITEIYENTFVGLTSLEKLQMGVNQISAIESGAFDPLTSINELNLAHNLLSNMATGGLPDLNKIKLLFLNGNDLPTLSRDMFMNSSATPTELSLVINENPLECKTNLCWIFEAEIEGWLFLYDKGTGLEETQPATCVNGGNWLKLKQMCSSGSQGRDNLLSLWKIGISAIIKAIKKILED